MSVKYTDARAAMRAESADTWRKPLNGTPTADAVAYARGAASASMLKAQRALRDVGNYVDIDAANQARKAKDAAKQVRDGAADVLKHGTSSARSFAPPSKSALTSAANVAVAAAIVEQKVHNLQDILKSEAAAITLIERAQEELEAAQKNLEAVLARAQSESTDAAQDYLAKLAKARRGY